MRIPKVLSILICALLLCGGYATAKSKSTLKIEPAPEVIQGAGGSIALGPVDTGQFCLAGEKPADTSETIQFLLKKELEGKGITSVTTVRSTANEVPALPVDRAPTQKEMNDYMKAMRQMTGQEKAHKPVSASYYFDFKVRTDKKHASTSEVTSTLGAFTGVDLSAARMSSDNTTVYLVCDQRDPQSGDLMDRFTAQSTSVEMTEVGGYYQYGGSGDNYMKIQKLFERAVKKCAGWMEKKVK